jgi:hypothetical protein
MRATFGRGEPKMTTKREFIEAYCLAAVSGAASTRSQLKAHDLIADAVDLWNALEEETVAQVEGTQRMRSKARAPAAQGQ